MHEILQNRRPSLFMLEKMSYCLFHTGKNTSFSLFIIFFSFFLWSCRSEYSDSSPAYILLLYTSWLIWPRCHTTIVNLQWTHMYKKSLLFKNRFVGPQKLKNVETEKHNSFFYLFLSLFFLFWKKRLTSANFVFVQLSCRFWEDQTNG